MTAIADIIVRTVDEGSRNVQSAAMRFTELKAKVDLASQAVSQAGEVVKTTYRWIGEGAQLQLARERFDNLSKTIGTTADALLVDMREATRGMISDADLIAGASDIINTGLSSNHEQTVRLATVVGTLGLDMQQVILTFANNSKARLDSLGLSISDVDERTQKFIAAGMDANEAFDLAVLEALEDKMAVLGDTAETTAGKMMRLEAAQENVTNRLKEMLAVRWEPIFTGIVNVMDIYADRQERLNAVIAAGVTTQEAYERAVLDNLTVGSNRLDVEKAVLEQFEQQVIAQREAITVAESYDRTLIGTSADIDKQVDFVQSLARANDDLADKTAQAGNQMSAYDASVAAAARASENARNANEEHARSFEEVAAAVDAVNQRNAMMNAETADFFNKLSDDNDLLAEYKSILGEVSYASFQVAGRSEEQQAALDELMTAHEKAKSTILSYEMGVRGVGLTEDERNEKIQEQRDRMAELDAAMQPLLGIQDEYNTVQTGGTINTELLNEKLFEQIQAHSDNAAAIAIAGEALGVYTEEEANALLKAALLEEAIKQQAESWDGTREGAIAAQGAIRSYITELNNIPDVVSTTVQVNWSQVGGVPEALGGVSSGLTTGEGETFQHGSHGWRTVPAGFPNDSFPIFLSSGEQFNVVPAGQRGATGPTYMDNSTTIINARTREAAAMATALINERRRTRLNRQMGI